MVLLLSTLWVYINGESEDCPSLEPLDPPGAMLEERRKLQKPDKQRNIMANVSMLIWLCNITIAPNIVFNVGLYYFLPSCRFIASSLEGEEEYIFFVLSKCLQREVLPFPAYKCQVSSQVFLSCTGELPYDLLAGGNDFSVCGERDY